MFLLDNQDYDPFKDFFNNFSKALSDDHRLTDIKDNIEANAIYTDTQKIS